MIANTPRSPRPEVAGYRSRQMPREIMASSTTFVTLTDVDDTPRRKMYHETPEWVSADATFFITVCATPRGQNHLCRETVGRPLLDSIIYYHERRKWFCGIAVLMPDHIHMMLTFPDVPKFSKIVGDWKRWTTKQLGIPWQEDFFDHRVRNEDSDKWKGDYIFNNPVRAGLVQRPEDWPYFWTPKAW